MVDIAFDPATHTYRVAGKLVPSVTGIIADCGLSDVSMISPELLAQAGAFGTEVHIATAYADQGLLDKTMLMELPMSYVRGWMKFREDFKAKIVDAERIVYSARFGYAGTLDRIAEIDGKLTVVDIKTGGKMGWHGVQTAAYASAYTEMTGVKRVDRMCVYLKPNNYAAWVNNDFADLAAWKAAVAIYKYKRSK